MLTNPRFKTVITVLITAIIFSSCLKKAPQGKSEFVFGTICTLKIQQDGKNEVYRRVFSRLHAIENTFSLNKAGTVVDLINLKAGIEPVSVQNEVIKVLERALFFAELSDGIFDPSVGTLVKLWGIGTENPHIPSQEEIEEALSLVNWRDIVVDAENSSVFLKKKGMMLDLGGIVKGYAADETLSILKSEGISGALIDFGGNIVVYGEKSSKGLFGKTRPWKIGIQHPRKERGEFVGSIDVENSVLVTSGDYERFFDEGGRRYHHILSTRTGGPIETDVLSVTVIQSLLSEGEAYNTASMDADALSTTLFALGYAGGSSYLSQFAGLDAIFVLKNGEIRVTQAIRGRFNPKPDGTNTSR